MLIPSWSSNCFCSALGEVTRRKRISRPSVVGRTISALTSVPSEASALLGDRAEPFRRNRCFSVTHSA